MNKPTKEQIITLLYAWVAQRPGLDFANYYGKDRISAGGWIRASFRREYGAHMQKRWFD